MWEPQIVDHLSVEEIILDSLISGKVPMIIIRSFYDQKSCRTAVERIKNHDQARFQDGELRHIGPFLMAHATDKGKYFKDSTECRITLKEIFCGITNPVLQIYEAVGRMFPDHSVSLAREFQYDYSQAVIRIHEKGRSVPVHKDNVKYEGREYDVSSIDHQLSCVLHLQESESGGDLVLYNRSWKKDDEQFRNIDFGYSRNLTESSQSYRAPNLEAGDLVIINPIYYHEVTRIIGDVPRITLGMFLGFYSQKRKIVAWA
ncbi:MAG: phytanoyl-CoA dioxygenase family protein [Nitrosopumilaceae archaeon]|nr:phytanoyl-CoA dioxygenase family protein [Nitrosopumilaceae archaeon]